jgi:hypothetical protein
MTGEEARDQTVITELTLADEFPTHACTFRGDVGSALGRLG